MKCPGCPLGSDPTRGCQGEHHARLCELQAAPGGEGYRATLVVGVVPYRDDVVVAAGPTWPRVPPDVRDAVNACPERGGVLPVSMQDECGCRGGELSECRAGKGTTPGRVTLWDCLTCQSKETLRARHESERQ